MLNRAVALAEVEGPDAALGLVDTLNLEGYYLYHSIRADLLRRRGRDAEAALAYERALALTDAGMRLGPERSGRTTTSHQTRMPWMQWPSAATAVASVPPHGSHMPAPR
jgi:hypothetical protein